MSGEELDKRAFWDRKILGWEQSRYEESRANHGLLERLAGRASDSLRFRITKSLELVAPYIAGRDIFEIGCGSGITAPAFLRLGANRYHGIDISSVAIDAARQRIAGDDFADRVTFAVGGIADMDSLAENPVIFSLGVVDWLDDRELDLLLNLQRGHDWFHAVPELRNSLSQWIHRAYVRLSYGRRTGGYVPRYHDLRTLVGRAHGDRPVHVFADRRLSFGVFLSTFPISGDIVSPRADTE